MKTTFLILISLFLFFACGNVSEHEYSDLSVESTSGSVNYDDSESDEMLRESAPPSDGSSRDESQGPTPEPKIIKTGNMRFEVGELAAAKAQADSLLRIYQGYYEREQYRTEYGSVAYDLVVRVPSGSFEPLLSSLENGGGKLTSKEISANDVSEEYVDLSLRLDSKMAYLEQYRAILKKATTIKDILQVQEKIRVIEEEIEAKKGRLRFLDDRVGLSTLRLTLVEQTDRYVAESPTFFSRAGDALDDGLSFLAEAVIAFISLWPFWVILVLILFVRKPVMRFFRGAKPKA